MSSVLQEEIILHIQFLSRHSFKTKNVNFSFVVTLNQLSLFVIHILFNCGGFNIKYLIFIDAAAPQLTSNTLTIRLIHTI